MTEKSHTARQLVKNGDELNLLDLLLVVVKRKTMILRCTMAAAVFAAIFSLFLPNTYTSIALIHPSKEDTGLASAMMAQLGGLASFAAGSIGGGTLTDLYVTMLKSEAIKDPIIDRFGLMKRFEEKYRANVYRRLNRQVVISSGKKDGVITIKFTDRDPRWAAALAGAYVRELGNLTIRLNVTGAGQNRSFLEKRLGEAKAELVRAEDALKVFQAKNKALDVPEQARATIGGVAQLRAQLALQEVQLATLRRQFTDASQEVKSARTSIDNLNVQINQMEGQGGGSIPSIGAVPELGQEYIRLMRDFKVQETIVELLTKQYELAKINESKDVTPFQVIQSPKVPEKKSGPKRAIRVIFATVTAFFLSVFYALAREYMDKMPEEDKARWRQIVDMSGIRDISKKAGSKWSYLSNKLKRHHRKD